MRKFWTGLLVGVVVAVAVATLAVCVASSVNGITFTQQIVEWFGTAPTVVA